MANIGAQHLADNPSLYEPARSNNFELIITGIDNLLAAGVDEDTATTSDYFTNAQEILRVSVDSSSVPNFELGEIEIKSGNASVFYAGTPTFGNQTVKINDYIGARTKDIIYALQAQAYDVLNQKVKMASNYKHDWTLVEYTPDYETVIRRITLKGAWIKGVSEGEFSNSDNSKRQITATVRYDWAIPQKGE